MRILYTNYQLDTGTGTEQVVRDLATAFRDRGNEVAVYCPRLGEMAKLIQSRGIPVVSRLEELPWKPEIVHGHHHVETLQALRAFPGSRGFFVCHDAKAWHDYPPRHSRLLAYIAVDLNCRERLEAAGISDARIIGNWVDLHRFHRRPALSSKPTRALIFSNYATAGASVDEIKSVCRDAGIDCAVIGQGAGNHLEKPEEKIGDFDLIFAKGKCAFESLASGAAVILYHADAIGSMVTTQNMAAFLPWNFGMRLITSPVQRQTLREQIDLYNPADALAVSDWVRANAGMDQALAAYQNLYAELMSRSLPPETEPVPDLKTPVHLPPASGLPLKRKSRRAIRIQLRQSPTRVRLQENFPVEIEIANHSKETLSSSGPFPVNASYHWLSPAHKTIIQEGHRTPIPRTIVPGECIAFWMQVSAPEQPGPYLLQLAFVQEEVFWSDQLSTSLAAEVRIEVG